MLDRFEIKKSEETGMFLIFDTKKYNTCIHNKKATDEPFLTKEDAERWIIRYLYRRIWSNDNIKSESLYYECLIDAIKDDQKAKPCTNSQLATILEIPETKLNEILSGKITKISFLELKKYMTRLGKCI